MSRREVAKVETRSPEWEYGGVYRLPSKLDGSRSRVNLPLTWKGAVWWGLGRYGPCTHVCDAYGDFSASSLPFEGVRPARPSNCVGNCSVL